MRTLLLQSSSSYSSSACPLSLSFSRTQFSLSLSLSVRLSLCTTYSTQPSLPLSPDVHQSIPPALTEPNLNLKPSLIMHPNSFSSVCVSVCACVSLSLSLFILSLDSRQTFGLFVCLLQKAFMRFGTRAASYESDNCQVRDEVRDDDALGGAN
jgi:hypothetical protein